jgi:hypoxanthine phosphoribosyltransferase
VSNFFPLTTETGTTIPVQDNIERILFDEAMIAERLDALAEEITVRFRGSPLTVVPVLHGSIFFVADLLRRVPLPLAIDSLTVSSYGGGKTSSGIVSFDQHTLPEVRNRHVLIVDDILDTGLTLASIRDRLLTEGNPLSITSCVLLRKKKVRVAAVDADLVGFDIADEFVVGYGLDYREEYRNLPYVGILKSGV